jgi:hypothetical protein
MDAINQLPTRTLLLIILTSPIWLPAACLCVLIARLRKA